VTRTVFIAMFAWAMLNCAPVNALLADTDSPLPATANTQIQAHGTEDSRLAQLAQRMAEVSPGDRSGETLGIEEGAPLDFDRAEGTPLLTRTPLLRPTSSNSTASDEGMRPGSMSWILKTLTGLGLVVGLALLVRWVYIRLGGTVATSSSPVVEVLSRTNVAPRSHVMLLRVGGRVLVVSDSSAGMRTLASLEDDQEVADILGAVSASKPNSISKGFGQFLNRFNEDYREQEGMDLVDNEAHGAGGVRNTVSGLVSRVRSMGRQGGPS
jgi:flagellar biogenesis protein FliO